EHVYFGCSERHQE
ncbi:hypothetical protein D046_7261B, partial [Vibrio parahaemolyticus V-223/04]